MLLILLGANGSECAAVTLDHAALDDDTIVAAIGPLLGSARVR